MSRQPVLQTLFAATLILPWAPITLASADAAEPKDATRHTVAANARVRDELPIDDQQDFEDARRSFIAGPNGGAIRDDEGNIVWDFDSYKFIGERPDAPDTVNPSLWRQERLNSIAGLFQVTEGIYQVRGYDLSNVTFVEGETGVIVVDPLLSTPTAKAAWQLYCQHRPKRPIVAVIYTHCHADHFGGVKGIVSEEEVAAGKVKVIAPDGFLQHAVSENVLAGNVMTRRASYMYGNLLPRGPRGQVGTGLGKTTSTGPITLIAPTDSIKQTGQEMTIDGVLIVFQITPDTEAPAEMNFYFPQHKALCMAENTTHTLHNLYTLRGAPVRDPKAWADYIQEAIELFGNDVDVVFAGHHWPCWGRERVVEYLKKQRDAYKYIHDQTLRLANHGYTMTEIAEMIQLPDVLAREFYNRGYYGSLNQNVKATYQRYLGWFDGNPANLHPLPPVEASRKYVEYMGGADAVLAQARKSYEQGEYRWVAQVVNHVVLAEPENQAARQLQADTFEQLAYQAESGPWRNWYLSGAKELRDGVVKAAAPSTSSRNMVKSMSLDMIFDFMAMRLNGPKAAGKKLTINFHYNDTNQDYVLVLENSVLHHLANKHVDDADATITMTRDLLNRIGARQTTLAQALLTGEIKIEGQQTAYAELYALLDNFDFWFPMVTSKTSLPNPPR